MIFLHDKNEAGDTLVLAEEDGYDTPDVPEESATGHGRQVVAVWNSTLKVAIDYREAILNECSPFEFACETEAEFRNYMTRT